MLVSKTNNEITVEIMADKLRAHSLASTHAFVTHRVKDRSGGGGKITFRDAHHKAEGSYEAPVYEILSEFTPNIKIASIDMSHNLSGMRHYTPTNLCVNAECYVNGMKIEIFYTRDRDFEHEQLAYNVYRKDKTESAKIETQPLPTVVGRLMGINVIDDRLVSDIAGCR